MKWQTAWSNSPTKKKAQPDNRFIFTADTVALQAPRLPSEAAKLAQSKLTTMTEKTPRNLPANDWPDDLIAWADENDVHERNLPRDKQAILRLTELNLWNNNLTALPEWLGEQVGMTYPSLWVVPSCSTATATNGLKNFP